MLLPEMQNLGKETLDGNRDYTGMWVRLGSTDLMAGKVMFLRSNQGGRFDGNESVADSFRSDLVNFNSSCTTILGAFYSFFVCQKKPPLSGSSPATRGSSALATVEGFAITAENYAKAVEILKDRFGRKDAIINSHMQKLLSVTPLKCSDDTKDEDIIEEVQNVADKKNEHYLPHHPVYKDNSTTKIRPVFDGSAKEKNSSSINECLEKGPNMVELIPTIVNKFRLRKFGITADIEKAFCR
ncbi:integrase_H2C2 domain-containing protein [Trichonephila clavipes]|nr:integrase_H2C2 domain-containing protein [Trichonephila clavipes]